MKNIKKIKGLCPSPPAFLSHYINHRPRLTPMQDNFLNIKNDKKKKVKEGMRKGERERWGE